MSDWTNRLDRATALIALLDEPLREDILQRLDPATAQSLMAGMQQLAQQPPTLRQRQQVLGEFEQLLKIARKYRRPQLRIHHDDGEDEAEEILPQYQLTGDALKDLEHINVHQLVAAFEQEHPRTTALLMKCLTPRRNADLLALLPNEVRDAVVKQLSLDPAATPLVIQQMAKGTIERAMTFPPKRIEQTSTAERMAEVLKVTDRSGRKQILESIAQQDLELANSIKRLLYQFEDIVKLSDREVQQVLSKIDGGTLAMAMFECLPEVKDRIFGNLTKRARATLQEELEFQRHLPASQVHAARTAVCDAIAEVDQEAE